MKKKLCKSSKYKMLCGVCGGWAEYLNWDPTVVRFIFIVFALLKGAGLILYILAAIIMPAPVEINDGDFSNAANEDDGSSVKTNKIAGKVKKSKIKPDDDKPHTDEEFDSFFGK